MNTLPCPCGSTGVRSHGVKEDGSPDLRCTHCKSPLKPVEQKEEPDPPKAEATKAKRR